MILTEREYRVFLKTHLGLLFHTGQIANIINKKERFENFVKEGLSIKFKCREHFLENADVLESYIETNFEKLTSEEISILMGFKKLVSSKFIIYKCLNEHAIFIDTKDNKVYAVKALGDPFPDLFHHFPILVEATILPFKDKIIYDGFLITSDMYFGGGLKATIKKIYCHAERNGQIMKTME